MAPLTVAIPGGTGAIGVPTARAFRSGDFQPGGPARVIVFTRDANSEVAQQLKAEGIELWTDPITPEAFKGVDAVINCMNSYGPIELRDLYAENAAKAGVSFYVNTEYGLDRRTNTRNHFILEGKATCDQHAREYSQKYTEGKMKVISCFTGVFIEWTFSLGPLFGFDYQNRKFVAVGTAHNPIAWTSLYDIAKSLVRFTVLVEEDPNSVPDFPHIMGNSLTAEESAKIVERITGDKVDVSVIDLKTLDESLGRIEVVPDFTDRLRVMMGEGKADFTKDNQDELVNPGQSLWKWKKWEDYMREVRGKEWN